jgi:hypothetical protein
MKGASKIMENNKFQFHHETNRGFCYVLNTETGEVNAFLIFKGENLDIICHRINIPFNE